jgi:hypothetical protein
MQTPAEPYCSLAEPYCSLERTSFLKTAWLAGAIGAFCTVEPGRRNRHIRRMTPKPDENTAPPPAAPAPKPPAQPRPREIGGPKGPEPTRYGDWEFNGRCTDF